MPHTAIITDTDSSLPPELAKKYAIAQVPIVIQFGNESFRAVYDIDDAATFERVDREGRIPTTAAPSPGEFVAAYQAAFDRGADSILVFTISSEMSAVFSAARTAAGQFPDRDIRVIDTRMVSLGEGFMVLAAAQALEKGASIQEAVDAAEALCERTFLFGALATLKYLAMSGRVGQVAAGLAAVLDVKPILSVQNGKLDLLERVRTQGKSWARTIELASEAAAGRKVERLGILHVNALESARQFEAQLRASLPDLPEAVYTEMTPGLSVHSGTGWVGLVIVVEG
ncbi:MAG TPA: DegV family protein [Anaerolineales bacterium]|nr:DegV family protein [Anaerolineales bacterium]